MAQPVWKLVLLYSTVCVIAQGHFGNTGKWTFSLCWLFHPVCCTQPILSPPPLPPLKTAPLHFASHVKIIKQNFFFTFHDDGICVYVFMCAHVTAHISADAPASARGCPAVYLRGCVCVYFNVYALLLVTTPHLAGLLLPPYIIGPKDL